MNIHDEERKKRLVKALLKAQEEANKANLYLVANDRDQEDIMTMSVVSELIEAALEHLNCSEMPSSSRQRLAVGD